MTTLLTDFSLWLDKMQYKFYINFIKDDRWLYISNGLKTTLEITFFAVFIGLIIGFAVATIRSTHDMTGKLKIPNALCKFYLTVIRGTPVIVQLMIIYFIILGPFGWKAFYCAIIGFGINSGAYVAEIVRGGIMSIDRGQMEAGRSLGFNYMQTMLLIVFPQAFKNVLPALANEFIVLLKETSVAGYISIQDLTKGGDIIRGRTMDAFMPLFAVALIYLTMVLILERLVGRLERRLRQSER
jgi:His/Glu/Gln/Arg/opine family amino acid ABC transporter permease subunit